MAVHMTLTDIEEYSLRLNTVLYNRITVGNVKLPKAVLNTVKIFVVYQDGNTRQALPIFFLSSMFEVQTFGENKLE